MGDSGVRDGRVVTPLSTPHTWVRQLVIPYCCNQFHTHGDFQCKHVNDIQHKINCMWHNIKCLIGRHYTYRPP